MTCEFYIHHACGHFKRYGADYQVPQYIRRTFTAIVCSDCQDEREAKARQKGAE